MAALGPRAGRRTVLVGDLNMRPRPAHRITGMSPLATGRTFPAHRPREQIDHILGSGLPTATPGRTVALPVSDHRALVVDL
jgi:endonuclease/exonuclease/phosphatase family metal-dependent hydrolase